jgi:hypothetical protein
MRISGLNGSVYIGNNVGIGTTNPNEALSIATPVNAGIGIYSSASKYMQFASVLGNGYYSASAVIGDGVIRTMGGANLMLQTGFGAAAIYINTSNNVGLGLTSPSYQLDLSTDGARKLTTSTWLTGSDARLKSNIQLADTARCYDIIKTVPLKRYTWRSDMDIYDSVKDRSKLGWIAQDVEAVFPKAVDRNPIIYNQKYEEVIKEDGSVEKKLVSQEVIEDCLTLNADQIYAVMYGAVQTLIQKGEEKDSQITALSITTQELKSENDGLKATLADRSAQLDALMAWAKSQGFAG